MDEFLPKAILDAMQNILSMLGSVVVVAVLNPYILFPIGVLSVLFILLQKVYLKTSKNIKRLEGIGESTSIIQFIQTFNTHVFQLLAKSPVFTHLSATLQGLSTVRAFEAEKILVKEFDNHQDTHSACWFMVLSTTAVFSFSIDLLCFLFITCILLYYMLFESTVGAENVGLAVSQALSLTGLVPWGKFTHFGFT